LRGGAVVLGIGVNVNQTEAALPPDTKVAAGSLRTATGREHDREQLLERLLRTLGAAYERWRADGLAALHDELSARDLLRGRHVVAGGKAGIAAGIDTSGRLRLETEEGVTFVESGEVVLDP
jgi:BirA family biotin operon repressor/biotin-[acetyl-CoA-carboxylase] ligase